MNVPSNSTAIAASIDEKQRTYLDTAAVFLSGVCMLHCLALPVVLTVLPVLNISLLEESIFHLLLLVFILPVSLIALSIGCRQHKDFLTLMLGVLGLSILTFTATFGHALFGITGERIVTSIGGLILASAHIRNYLCCRKHACNHDH